MHGSNVQCGAAPGVDGRYIPRSTDPNTVSPGLVHSAYSRRSTHEHAAEQVANSATSIWAIRDSSSTPSHARQRTSVPIRNMRLVPRSGYG